MTATISASALRTIATERAGLDALHQAIGNGLAEPFAAAVEMIRASSGRVIVTGMGKSGHVGRKIAATLASTGTPSHFVHPAEASHGDLGMVRPEDVVIALSWSGEAVELSAIVGYTRRFRVGLIAITANRDSALGREADVALVLPKAEEACPNGLAPTTSTTMQMALGDALAVALLEARGFSRQDFYVYHPGGKLGSQLRKLRDMMHGGSSVPLVPDDASLSQAIVEMTGKRFGITGVVDKAGRLIGVVTDGDVRRAFEAAFVDRPVREVMTPNPRSVAPDLLAQEALALMNRLRITSLFVMEGDRPAGIIHLHDLLRSGVA